MFPALTLSDDTRSRAEFKAAMTLVRAGLVDEAAWYLLRLSRRRPRDRGLALLSTHASADAGDYAAVAQLLATHFVGFLQRPAEELLPDFYTLV